MLQKSLTTTAHARRDYSDAIKAADKSNPEVLKNSIAHQALERIAKFYEEEGKLKDLPSAYNGLIN